MDLKTVTPPPFPIPRWWGDLFICWCFCYWLWVCWYVHVGSGVLYSRSLGYLIIFNLGRTNLDWSTTPGPDSNGRLDFRCQSLIFPCITDIEPYNYLLTTELICFIWLWNLICPVYMCLNFSSYIGSIYPFFFFFAGAKYTAIWFDI